MIACSLLLASLLTAEDLYVHPHDQIRSFSNNGNSLRGLATEAMGAKQFEIWGSSIAVGSRTPLHTHETEETFIILKGKILAVIGGKEYLCNAPATLICPANIPHQLINVGDEPTEHFLVLGIGSKVYDAGGNEMRLPWR